MTYFDRFKIIFFKKKGSMFFPLNQIRKLLIVIFMAEVTSKTFFEKDLGIKKIKEESRFLHFIFSRLISLSCHFKGL